MLIIAPLGSWVYLKLGVDYRKGSLEQLTPKEIPSSLKAGLGSLISETGKAKLLHINSLDDSEAKELLNRIDTAIVDKTFFDIVSFGKSRGDAASGILYKNKEPIDYDYPLILLDSMNVMRAEYKMDENTGKDIMRHLAVVIPMPKQVNKIQLKRDIDK